MTVLRPSLILIVGLGVSAGSALRGVAQPPAPQRSQEVLRRDCRSAIGGQEITLFANGTLRERVEQNGESTTRLAEITPDETLAMIRRISAEDLNEVRGRYESPGGDWVEKCVLHIADPAASENLSVYRFDRLASLPLTLARIDAIADELVGVVADRAPRNRTRLPVDYLPMPGDLIERSDGVVFKVIALTADRKGVEISALEEPLVLYIPLESIGRDFLIRPEESNRP